MANTNEAQRQIGLCRCMGVEWVLYPNCPMYCRNCDHDIVEEE